MNFDTADRGELHTWFVENIATREGTPSHVLAKWRAEDPANGGIWRFTPLDEARQKCAAAARHYGLS